MKMNASYIDKKGNKYDGVIERALTNDELKNPGKFLHQTEREENVFIQTNGVYIYQDYNNTNIAYRIYDEYADYGFNGYRDEKLIYNLNKVKNNVKLTDFPMGVLTCEGNIIGQIIPYYVNSESVYSVAKKYKDVNIAKYYRKMLNILKELYDNGIIYVDTHAKNYLIVKNDIKLIDFDNHFIDFDNSKFKYESMIYTFVNMLKTINSLIGINYDLSVKGIRDLRDIEEVVEDIEKKF